MGLAKTVYSRWGALTRTGSPTDMVRYNDEVLKDQSDMDLHAPNGRSFGSPHQQGLFSGNPDGQMVLSDIMTKASIAVKRGVVFYGSR
jgi:hypothetical protein